MSPAIIFLSSADYARRTGGYVYNKRLIEALQDQGAAVQPLTLPTGFPTVPERDRAGLLATLCALPAGSVVLTDHIYLCDLAEVFAACTVPVVPIFHHSLVEEQGLSADERALALRQAEATAIARSARVLVSSGETAHYLRNHYGADPQKLRVAIPGNPDVPRSAAGRQTGTAHILSVGAVIARKRYDYMLEVAAHLTDLDWRWQIAGDPQRDPAHFAALTARARDLGLADRLTFLGDVSDEALETAWQQADLYVATSSYEGYGMAVAEALRHGVPAVTTASGAVATWATGGVVQAPSDDPAAMAALMRPLLRDRAPLQTLADAAWTFGQTLPGWEETFAGVAGWLDGARR
ncbi:glycosyltransferase family 4 protein [Rhizobium sp. CSW-27]|uniref:glycosyltransferase family 4 protein n=1 Tax=Rhizobium sp. CSW-27 TaxID=2839985 RepID=UPI001C030B7A|nr:glycosyltransferase family 4 protein [Rhizobium sp. CSW-27]MBT9368749.1 glycosyltransferase family 4 protein [Rhizobium sp. CSW-27]